MARRADHSVREPRQGRRHSTQGRRQVARQLLPCRYHVGQTDLQRLVSSLEDMEQIVVSSTNGVPILVKDIATVRYGSANRFGAITANGKGETILGQVMMLKNANSKEVIKAVQERVCSLKDAVL